MVQSLAGLIMAAVGAGKTMMQGWNDNLHLGVALGAASIERY